MRCKSDNNDYDIFLRDKALCFKLVMAPALTIAFDLTKIYCKFQSLITFQKHVDEKFK